MANAPALLSTLADPTRRSLVTQSAVSQHLQVLKAAHLVEERRDGARRYYSLDPAALGELRAYVDALWNDALNAFSKE
jgi:DNA-binding transcriptional ArsR family regulator